MKCKWLDERTYKEISLNRSTERKVKIEDSGTVPVF